MGRFHLVYFVFVWSGFFIISSVDAEIKLYDERLDDDMTTGRHLIVMKSWTQTPNMVPKPTRHLADIAQTIQDSYNVTVLHRFTIGHWRALLVDVGDNGVTRISSGSDNDIDFMETERRVRTFDQLPKHNNDNNILKTPQSETNAAGEQKEQIGDKSVPIENIVESDTKQSQKEQINVFKSPSADPETREKHKFISEVQIVAKGSWSRDVKIQNQTTPEPVCYQQTPGEGVWALPRISHHTRPSYRTSPYLFTSIDQGAGVDAYIVDTGVRITHTELKGRAEYGHVAGGMNQGPEDANGHGTHVASLVAGHSVGVAKLAHVISVKVLNDEGIGDVSWILEGLQWISDRLAEQRAAGKQPKAVINLSLGTAGISYSLDHAVQAMVEDVGVPVVAAAGNDKSDACLVSPARVSSAITVAATNDKDQLASFTNYGSCVNMLSPGDAILGAYGTGDDTYALISGTSQATPIVAGVLTRYISSLGGAPPTPAFLKAYLQDTASIDYIKFDSTIQSTTPNRLVYRACESMGADLPAYRPTFPTNKNVSGSGNMMIFYLVPVLNFGVLFLALVLMMFNFQCPF